MADHFDPETAKCYKFGSLGGKSSDELQAEMANNVTGGVVGDDNNFYSILKDLTENSDRMWLVLVILISLSILLFLLIFMLVRKHYLGYCWTAHKKEYEPNNKNPAKNGYFNKNSINNKSFKRKSLETDEEDGGDGSNLVGSTGAESSRVDGHTNRAALVTSPAEQPASHHNYVKVNMNDDASDPYNNTQLSYHHHKVASPLTSSTSTPV